MVSAHILACLVSALMFGLPGSPTKTIDDGVEGRVVDRTGEAVARVGLRLVAEPSQKTAFAWTAADGRFRAPMFAPQGDQIRVEVVEPGPCEPTEIQRRYRFGEAIEIVLQRGLQLTLTVRDRVSDKPITDYGVRWAYGDRPPTRIRHRGKHADGQLVIEGIRRGPGALEVFPDHPELRLSDPVSFVAKDGEPLEVEVLLDRLQWVEIRLIDAAGRPIRDHTAETLELRGNRPKPRMVAVDPRAGWSPQPEGGGLPALQLHRSRSDREGRLRLLVPTGAHVPWALRVFRDHHCGLRGVEPDLFPSLNITAGAIVDVELD